MIAVFLFFNDARGVQARLAFSKQFKHVNCVLFDGDRWVYFEFGAEGLQHKVFKPVNGGKMVRRLRIIKSIIAIVGVDIQYRVKSKWRPFIVQSCNEICRKLTAVDIGFTFNPLHFYRKIFRYDAERNYTIIYRWVRDGIF